MSVIGSVVRRVSERSVRNATLLELAIWTWRR